MTQLSIDDLQRWRDFGATWRVLARTPSSATLSLCRCDGGEEVQRATIDDPLVLTWLDAQPSPTA
jgi:hypothetical protein